MSCSFATRKKPKFRRHCERSERNRLSHVNEEPTAPAHFIGAAVQRYAQSRLNSSQVKAPSLTQRQGCAIGLAGLSHLNICHPDIESFRQLSSLPLISERKPLMASPQLKPSPALSMRGALEQIAN